MKSTKKKLSVDLVLLFISYCILFVLWYKAITAIFLPYQNTLIFQRPDTGILISFQNYFEVHNLSLLAPVLFLFSGSILLLWHRIAKRKESLDHVIQHTYVSNYGYIFLKTFFLFFITLLPKGHTLTSSPALFEVYTIILIHFILIFLLFLVHHKNIIFGKKYLSIKKYLE